MAGGHDGVLGSEHSGKVKKCVEMNALLIQWIKEEIRKYLEKKGKENIPKCTGGKESVPGCRAVGLPRGADRVCFLGVCLTELETDEQPRLSAGRKQ